MEQSPSSEAAPCSTGRDTASLLRNAMARYRVCRFLSRDTRPSYTLTPNFFNYFCCLFL